MEKVKRLRQRVAGGGHVVLRVTAGVGKQFVPAAFHWKQVR